MRADPEDVKAYLESQKAVRAKRDLLLGELRALRQVIDAGEAAKERRLEVWVELRDLKASQAHLPEDEQVHITQAMMAEASNYSGPGVTGALKRYDAEAAKVAGKVKAG